MTTPHGLSQAQLAEMAGVSPSAIGRLECSNYDGPPPTDVVERIGEALKGLPKRPNVK